MIAIIARISRLMGSGHLQRSGILWHQIIKRYPSMLFCHGFGNNSDDLRNILPQQFSLIATSTAKPLIARLSTNYTSNSHKQLSLKRRHLLTFAHKCGPGQIPLFIWQSCLPLPWNQFFQLCLLDGRYHSPKLRETIRKYSQKIIFLDEEGLNEESLELGNTNLYIDTLPRPEIDPMRIGEGGLVVPRKITRLNYLILSQAQDCIKAWHKRRYDFLLIMGRNDPFGMERIWRRFPYLAHRLLSEIETNGIETNRIKANQTEAYRRKASIKIAIMINDRSLGKKTDSLLSKNIDFISYGHDFQQVLSQSRVVVGYYGLTIYEALLQQAKVVLIGFTDYHYQISQYLCQQESNLCIKVNLNSATTIYEDKKASKAIFCPKQKEGSHGLANLAMVLKWLQINDGEDGRLKDLLSQAPNNQWRFDQRGAERFAKMLSRLAMSQNLLRS